MNLEKFTDRAKGFLQAAQTVAIRMSHQRISPEHLLKALIEDGEGMASGLIQRAGGDPRKAESAVDAALAKVPAVSGGGAQATPGLDNDLVRLLDQAEKVADKAGDSYVTVERLLLALALAKTTAAGQALQAANVTPEALNDNVVSLARLGEEAAGAAGRKAEARRRAERLTQRERDVLRGLIHGNSNKETAVALGISPRTVEIHRGNMMARLNARSTGDAVRMGLEAGLAD